MTSPTTAALKQFIDTWQALHHQLPTVIDDPQWPSACLQADHTASPGTRYWRPVAQTTPTDMFARLAEALGVDLHRDIVEYYQSYWSDPLWARADEGDLQLLQVWNAADLERLRANLIGHALAKQRQRLPLTLFFALTEPDDGIISLLNDDGSIWLEYPGTPPQRQLADNLAQFLGRLSPRLQG